MTGISRKLPDTERNRLKQILKKVKPENVYCHRPHRGRGGG
jgi:Ribonuclease G/E